MSKKPTQHEPDETPNVSMLYDDGLPASLRSKQAKRAHQPNVHVGDNVVISPYVIHLSHNDAEVSSAAPNLDALAAQLFGDDQPEMLETHDRLEVSFDDVAPQLNNPDVFFNDPRTTTLPEPVEHAHEAFFPPATLEVTREDYISVDREIFTDLERVSQAATRPVAETEHEPEPVDEPVEEQPNRSESKRLLPLFIPNRTRAVAAFVALSFAVVLPLHALQGVASTGEQEIAITSAGQAAIDNFLRATQALEADKYDVASSDFEAAHEAFATAEESLNDMNLAVSTLVQVIPQTDKSYDTVSGLIRAGGSLTGAAATLSNGLENVNEQSSTNIITKMRQMSSYVEAALPDVLAAEHALEQVDASRVPADYQDLARQLQTTTPAIARSMQEFLTFADTLAALMGEDEKMRYLVAFQNNTELRPTGGFIGSFAEMDVRNGRIEQVNIPGGGTYDLQGQLTAFVEAPQPLTLLNARWEFHDANWFPDFPSSAKKLLWFYEKAGGPTVDGVLAINASMIPDLLAILGPVDMPEYGRTIDAENFLFETQKIVELEYEQYDENEDRVEDAPKQFIGDLAPILLERMQTAETEQLLAIVDIVGAGLSQKDIQLYFSDNDLQSHIESIGWSGKQKHTSGDYLMVVNTNLGGGKTDNVIDQTIDVDVDIRDDGRIINTVTITKEHRGIRTALFEGANNVDYIRLYVPKGARLIDASGFEIPPEHLFETSDLPLYADDDIALLDETRTIDPVSRTDIWEENGKTVFGNWIQTAPGEIEQVTFSYELPFAFNAIQANPTLLEIAKSHLGFKQLETYTMLVQKQSGVEGRETNVRVSWPQGSEVVWHSHVADTEDSTPLSNERDVFFPYLVENHLP